jgi:hypothetical protein
MEGRTDGSVTISLRNFVGEGIINNIDIYVCTSTQILFSLYAHRYIILNIHLKTHLKLAREKKTILIV